MRPQRQRLNRVHAVEEAVRLCWIFSSSDVRMQRYRRSITLASGSMSPTKSKRPQALILAIGAALVIGVWLLREPLREQIRERATLANEAPAPEVVTEMIEQAANPGDAL